MDVDMDADVWMRMPWGCLIYYMCIGWMHALGLIFFFFLCESREGQERGRRV